MSDYEVVSDSLRVHHIHRGRPTPQYVYDLIDGKTLRLKKSQLPTARKSVARLGFKLTGYTKDGSFIAWVVKATERT